MSSARRGFGYLRCARPCCSSPVPSTTKKSPDRSRIPVDIPTGWEPRTNQSPTGALVTFAALGRAVRVLYRPPQKNPQTKWSGDRGGALSIAVEPKTSSTIIAKVEGKRESKNRPVATNFQFLKISCPSETSLLKLCRVSEVLLLGRACPKPCLCLLRHRA